MNLGECDLTTLALAAVGALVIIFFILDSLWSVLQGARAILAPFFLPNEESSLSKKFGSWALVTGCTDGIGLEYSKQLASRGINLVLVSRSEDKLQKTAAVMESEYSVKTKIITADFTKGSKIIEHIRNELGNLPVGILVNNVGKQYEYPMYLGEVPENELWDIININIGATTMMTRLLIEDMKRRGKGAIVNVSSSAEIQPLPLMNVYAATKAYIKNFSAALRYEYASSGITVQHLSPMFINTKMNAFSDRLQVTSFLVPDAKSYARYAVSTLGIVDHSTGYWTHGIQYFFSTIPPVWIRMNIGGYLNSVFREDYFRNQKIQ